jgi:hypothetical protein
MILAKGDSEMTMSERLDQLAEQGDGEITIAPEAGQDLEAFQATVSFLRDYERQGYLIIVRPPHKEARSGRRHIDRVRVRLTPKGVQWRKSLRNAL